MQNIVSINSTVEPEISLLSGLKSTNKFIPTKYLYDDYGSKLFEEICITDEYYLTRLEQKILSNSVNDIIKITNPQDFFELGSGAAKKTKLLINEKLKYDKEFSYSSLDISAKALEMGFNEIKMINKKLTINLFLGDFISDLKNLNLKNKNRLFLFLGSTIGNFKNTLAIKFLTNLHKIMKEQDHFLLGVDMIKNDKIITSAYNDKEGITGKFNKNILKVINKKYDLNFNQSYFEHEATFNSNKSQIEMFLKSTREQTIDLHDNNYVKIKAGEKILTEISRKFSMKDIRDIFKNSNLKIIKQYQDKNKYYSLFLLKAN